MLIFNQISTCLDIISKTKKRGKPFSTFLKIQRIFQLKNSNKLKEYFDLKKPTKDVFASLPHFLGAAQAVGVEVA